MTRVREPRNSRRGKVTSHRMRFRQTKVHSKPPRNIECNTVTWKVLINAAFCTEGSIIDHIEHVSGRRNFGIPCQRSSEWTSHRMRSRSNLRMPRKRRSSALLLHGSCDKCCCRAYVKDGKPSMVVANWMRSRSSAQRQEKRLHLESTRVLQSKVSSVVMLVQLPLHVLLGKSLAVR